MKKVLIAYDSVTGNTQQMAEYVAEGIRVAGHQATVKKIGELKLKDQLEGYDAWVFGSPTYHRDMMGTMKTFLFLARNVEMDGKVCGAFGSYTHSGDAPKVILDTMEHVFKMKPTSLGSLNLIEDIVSQPDGLKACQDYGKAVGEALEG